MIRIRHVSDAAVSQQFSRRRKDELFIVVVYHEELQRTERDLWRMLAEVRELLEAQLG